MVPDWFYWIGVFLVALNVLIGIVYMPSVGSILNFAAAGGAGYVIYNNWWREP
jgi:hypothetical protein